MSTDTPFGNPNAADDEVFELTDEEQAALDGSDDKFGMDEGQYRARVVDLSQGVSKSGNNMWIWTWAIVAGKYDGRELKLWTALTPRAMFKLREVLEAIGVFKAGEKVRIVPSQIVGKEAVIGVVVEEYNGRDSPKIEKVLACDDQAPSSGFGDNDHNPMNDNSDDDIPF